MFLLFFFPTPRLTVADSVGVCEICSRLRAGHAKGTSSPSPARVPKLKMSQSEGDDDVTSLDIFQEPEDFYQPEKPATFTTYTLRTGQAINLRLVGHSPLWV